MARASDHIVFKPAWTIVKYRSRSQEKMRLLHYLLHYRGLSIEAVKEFLGERPVETLSFTGNLMLNEGLNLLWTLVCGGTGTPYSNANARIGVGDGTATESADQTGLQGTNKYFKGMDSGYPVYGSAQKATWRATFGTDEANFAWNEITVVNGPDDTYVNLNRKVQAMGTKASGSVWIATLEITGS
jgi:hypothetical protein